MSTLASLLFVAAVSSSSFSIVTAAAAADPENKVLIDGDGNLSMMPYSPPTTTVEDTHQSRRLELYHRLLKFNKNKKGNNKGQLKKKSIKVKVIKPKQKKIDDIKSKMNKAEMNGTPLQVGLTEVTSEPIPLVIDTDSGISETCIQSDDAGGINLHLNNLIIPKDVEVIITCPLAESELVYEVNEWTYTCPGDEVCVNIVSKEEDGGSSSSSTGDIIGYVTEIGYMVDDSPLTPWGVRRRELYGCDFPSCYQDVCDANGIPENLYPDAVAGMLYNKDGGWFVCTGSLINNLDNKLYFLTANHCLSTQESPR